MIYAAFSVYLLGILFAAMGVYRLWAGMVKPGRVNWALLPGTVVAEMAYIFGCLITGGEVRRAKLMDAGKDGSGRGKSSPGSAGEAEPTTEDKPKLRYIGPIVAAFMTILACGAGILIANAVLGEPVIDQFQAGGAAGLTERLKEFPTSTGAFWDQFGWQVNLLHRMVTTCTELKWTNWRVPLFVYLAMCLTIRLAPVRRPLRPTLAAVVVMAGIIALIGIVWGRSGGLMDKLWPLVMYVWASLLFMLWVSLIVRGGVGLARALAGKDAPKSRPRRKETEEE
ncbi:MAG: hypothetical protein SVV80_03930 [Planctomycetota bacterium]|nr:hypothetical protein [Planctomycetota bacterium]